MIRVTDSSFELFIIILIETEYTRGGSEGGLKYSMCPNQ